ncbi:MAG: tyrosine-type recombinase/integrase [Candidatus Sedimenticola sp. (ex Thyasira tokunagai)]
MDKQHLLLRRQRWYVRVRVPTELVPVVGKAEIVRSLKTADLREARDLRWNAIDQIKDYLATFSPTGDDLSPELLVSEARRIRRKVDLGLADDGDSEVVGMDVLTEMVVAECAENQPEAVRSAVLASSKIMEGQPVVFASEVLKTHLAEIKSRVRIQTLNARERRVKVFLRWLGGSREITRITRKEAGRYLTEDLLQQGKAIKTTKDTLSDLSAFFNWAVDRGFIEANPFAGLNKTVRITTRGTKDKHGNKRRVFTPDELKKLLVTLRDERGKEDPLWALTLMGLYSGMRGNEIAEIEVSDVHGGYIHIPEGKTESSVRDVPIHPVIQQLVEDLKETSKDGYLISGLKRGGEDNKRYHLIGKRFGTALRQGAKMTDKRVVFHSLRKNFSSALENAGVPVTTAEQIVGC